jgi:hypothetical protein
LTKKLFTKFWEYQEEGRPRRLFKDRFVTPQICQQMFQAALEQVRHFGQWFETVPAHPAITNAVTEGLNSKIQSIKAAVSCKDIPIGNPYEWGSEGREFLSHRLDHLHSCGISEICLVKCVF